MDKPINVDLILCKNCKNEGCTQIFSPNRDYEICIANLKNKNEQNEKIKNCD